MTWNQKFGTSVTIYSLLSVLVFTNAPKNKAIESFHCHYNFIKLWELRYVRFQVKMKGKEWTREQTIPIPCLEWMIFFSAGSCGRFSCFVLFGTFLMALVCHGGIYQNECRDIVNICGASGRFFFFNFDMISFARIVFEHISAEVRWFWKIHYAPTQAIFDAACDGKKFLRSIKHEAVCYDHGILINS